MMPSSSSSSSSSSEETLYADDNLAFNLVCSIVFKRASNEGLLFLLPFPPPPLPRRFFFW